MLVKLYNTSFSLFIYVNAYPDAIQMWIPRSVYVCLPRQHVLCTPPSWNSSRCVLAKQILPLILVPCPLLGKVQASRRKHSMKTKILDMPPSCSLRVGNNQAVTCWGWPSSRGRREVSPLPILWEEEISSFPLSFLLIFCLPAVPSHSLPCCNVYLCCRQKLCIGWPGLRILQRCL